MNFSEQPPSKQWAALKYRGETVAEVWFKPEGEPFALRFRVPQRTFQIPGAGPLLTAENLLKAVGIAAEEVDSWHSEGASGADLASPLPPPPQDVSHLELHVSLKPPPQAAAPDASPEAEIPEAKWQELEVRWNTILGLEANLDGLRISMEGVRVELEALSRQALTPDQKVHALNADVVQWNKAKGRIVYALPKTREFIHRATWAAGTPERKKLEELFKNHIKPRLPFPEVRQAEQLLESLFKDRQVLSAHGTSIFQECKSISAEVQATLRTLQSNAAAIAIKKRGQAARGKSR